MPCGPPSCGRRRQGLRRTPSRTHRGASSGCRHLSVRPQRITARRRVPTVRSKGSCLRRSRRSSSRRTAQRRPWPAPARSASRRCLSRADRLGGHDDEHVARHAIGEARPAADQPDDRAHRLARGTAHATEGRTTGQHGLVAVQPIVAGGRGRSPHIRRLGHLRQCRPPATGWPSRGQNHLREPSSLSYVRTARMCRNRGTRCHLSAASVSVTSRRRSMRKPVSARESV
jgi:hypothetical protein